MDPTTISAVVVLAVAIVVLAVVAAVLWRRLASLDRRLAGLTSAGDGTSLESTLHATLDRVASLSSGVDAIGSRAATLATVQRTAIQRTGLVRYNPFDDTGGNQSFALALLDADGNGVVVSSLHARQNTRVYAKAVTGGSSEAALSHEEAEALRQALDGSRPVARPS